MSEHNSYLCVGGPRAGWRVDHKGMGFAVPVQTSRTLVNSYEETQPEFDRVEYRRGTFSTPQGSVSMWVPSGQTELETMTMLLETYEQAMVVKRVTENASRSR